MLFVVCSIGCNTFTGLGSTPVDVGQTEDVGQNDTTVEEDAEPLPLFQGDEWIDIDRPFRWTLAEGEFYPDIAIAGYKTITRKNIVGDWRVLIAWQTVGGMTALQDLNIDIDEGDEEDFSTQYDGPSPFNSAFPRGVALRSTTPSSVGFSINYGDVGLEVVDWAIVTDGVTSTNELVRGGSFEPFNAAAISGGENYANHWHVSDTGFKAWAHAPQFSGDPLSAGFQDPVFARQPVGDDSVYVRDTNDRLGLIGIGSTPVLFWDSEQTEVRETAGVAIPGQEHPDGITAMSNPQLVGLGDDEYAFLYLGDFTNGPITERVLWIENLFHNTAPNNGTVTLNERELRRPLPGIRRMDATDVTTTKIVVAAARENEVEFILLEDIVQDQTWTEIACSKVNITSLVNEIQVEVADGGEHVVAIAATSANNKIELVATRLTEGVMCD